MLELALFIGFFVFAVIAVYLRNHKAVRTGFIVVFFLVFTVAGITGYATWPFATWTLFSSSSDGGAKFSELWVVTEDGNELPYDAHAVPPALYATLHNLAYNMKEYNSAEQVDVSCYLLHNAIEYVGNLETGFNPLSFPRHQQGIQWNTTHPDTITGLKLYDISTRVSRTGAVISNTKTPVLKVNTTTCS